MSPGAGLRVVGGSTPTGGPIGVVGRLGAADVVGTVGVPGVPEAGPTVPGRLVGASPIGGRMTTGGTAVVAVVDTGPGSEDSSTEAASRPVESPEPTVDVTGSPSTDPVDAVEAAGDRRSRSRSRSRP